MKRPRIGLVTCVHPLYDVPGMAEQRQRAIDGLQDSGCEVIAAGAPRTAAEAVASATDLRNGEIDLLALFFCTWVAEEVTLTLARELADIPLLLWALPYLDRDIPMPSPMSGLTASGANIRRLGKRFAYVVGAVQPPVLERIFHAARAAAVVRDLRAARFGIIGSPCPGMLDVESDERALQEMLGATAVHFDLEELLERARAAEPADVIHASARLIETCGASAANERDLAGNLRLYVALRQLVSEHRLDGYCVRCWPELRDRQRITPCAAHALLAEEGVPSTCEVDLPALLTTYVLSRLAGAPAFNFDITAYLEDRDAIQLAHCGAAAPSLAAAPADVQLLSHMRTGTGLTVEFPFREGRATVAKLTGARPQSASQLKLFATGATVISSEGARGSVATVKPVPSAAAFLDKWMREGVEHHMALVYGDWQRDLELFCEFTGVRYVTV